jgi:hypothetical protein
MATPAAHVRKPSSARRVLLDGFIPEPRGSTIAAPPLLSWPPKDPIDVLDYQLDISPAMVGNDGDTIATLDVMLAPSNPGDLTLNDAQADGNVAVLWLAGGQADVVYTVTLVITTVAGRTIQRSVLLPVLHLSTLPISANVLQTDTGVIVTDQNGNPVLTTS